MRIRTITCHYVYNHGALLQAWALVSYLHKLGHDAKIIDYRPTRFYKLEVNNPKYDYIPVRWLYLVAKFPKWLISLKRKRAFDLFYKKYMDVLTTSNTYTSQLELENNPPDADLYIAGSDQIWNTELRNGKDSSFYLSFGSKRAKRISYAASYATKTIASEWKEFVRKHLSNFDSISVRENSGLNITKSLGYNAYKVVDPVLLISRDEWTKRFGLHLGEGESYVLIYDCENSEEIKIVAKRYAKLFKTKIYSIGSQRLDYADKNYVYNGPQDFIALIKNAQCVFSNSFHGSVFSMIFNSDFFVINRADGLNTRMTELLSDYNLPSRLIDSSVSDSTLSEHIDFIPVNELLEIHISSSKKWLKNYLS